MQIPHEIDDAIQIADRVVGRYWPDKSTVAERLKALKAEVEQIRALPEPLKQSVPNQQ